MNSQSGLITLDFIFALVIGFGMSAILFALTFTLSVVEVSQYITFAAARAYAAGNSEPKAQESVAREKYDKLLKNTAFRSLFTGGWFEISDKNSLEIKGGPDYGGTFTSDYRSTSSPRPLMTGVRVKLTAKMLDLKLPMIGSTSEDEGGFSTRLSSILIRESTQVECQSFIKDRFAKINQLDPRFKNYSNQKNYFAMEDNGC